VIGKPLKLSPAFPPLHTVRETFTSYGVPTNPISINHWHFVCLNSFVSISRCRPVEGEPLLVLQEPYWPLKICLTWLTDSSLV